MNINFTDKQRKSIQWISLLGLIALVVWGMLVITEPPQTGEHTFDNEPAQKEISVARLTDGARENDRWLEMSSTKLSRMDEELDDLREGGTIRRSEFVTLKEALDKLQTQKKLDDQNAKEIIGLQADTINDLGDKLELIQRQLDKEKSNPSNVASRPNPNTDPFRTVGTKKANTPYKPVSPIETIDFELSEIKGAIKTFDTDTYIPAGSYVKATIIEGVSASVGLTAGVDPRPIELRVEGKAISAIGPDGPETFDLKGCVAIGAARGDLSSERVYVQLLKLTCSHEAGSVFEVSIKAHVSSGGQAGVRGNVVKRDNEYTQKSFLAGVFSGGGEGLNALATPPASFGGGGFATQERPSLTDVAGMAAGKGFSSAGDRLSDYYIKQAEQYQPVVEVSPGISVEIVFTEGVQLNVG